MNRESSSVRRIDPKSKDKHRELCSRKCAKYWRPGNLEKYKLIYNHTYLCTKDYDVRNGIIKEELFGKFAFKF